MKNIFLKLCFCAAALTAGALTVGAATISVVPSNQTVGSVGDPVSVDILFSGLGNGASPALAFYDFTLTFNDAILSPAQVLFTNRLGDASNPGEVISINSFVAGGVYLLQYSWLDAAGLFARQTSIDDSFVVATVTFNTIGSGTSPLGLSLSSAGDENGNSLLDSLNLQTGSVAVGDISGVPEPGTFAVAGAALGTLAFLRRRAA